MTTPAGWFFCLKCGAELDADARFCSICGHAVRATAGATHAGGPVVIVAGEELPLAPVGKRIGALIIDVLVLGAAFYALSIALFVIIAVVSVDETEPAPGISISTEVLVAIVVGSTLVTTLVGWLFDAYGWSPGKAATGIRAVRLDGRRPGIVHGLVRYSMRGPGFALFGLGYLWALWDDHNQTWHDKLSDSVVVRVRPLEERLPDRRADPLVTRARMWWLAALGTMILMAGLAANVWWASTIDGDLFDESYFEPYRLEDNQRVAQPGLDRLSVRIED